MNRDGAERTTLFVRESGFFAYCSLFFLLVMGTSIDRKEGCVGVRWLRTAQRSDGILSVGSVRIVGSVNSYCIVT